MGKMVVLQPGQEPSPGHDGSSIHGGGLAARQVLQAQEEAAGARRTEVEGFWVQLFSAMAMRAQAAEQGLGADAQTNDVETPPAAETVPPSPAETETPYDDDDLEGDIPLINLKPAGGAVITEVGGCT